MAINLCDPENLAGQVTTTAWDQFACTSVDELISAAKNAKSAKHAYDFDDIGNSETSSERGTNSVYTFILDQATVGNGLSVNNEIEVPK